MYRVHIKSFLIITAMSEGEGEGEGEDFLRLVVTNAVSSVVTRLTAHLPSPTWYTPAWRGAPLCS